MTNGVNRNNLGATASWVFTPNASTVLDVAGGGNNNLEGNILTPVALGFTPSSVGLPSYLDAKAGSAHALPIMSFAGYDTLGQSVPAWTHFEIFSLKVEPDAHSRRAHAYARGSICATTGAPAAIPESLRDRSISRTSSPASRTTASPPEASAIVGRRSSWACR